MNTEYASIADLKAQVQTGDTDYDATFQLLLNAAAEAIDRFTNRTHKHDAFLADDEATARVYSAKSIHHLYIDECIEVTLVKVKDSATDTGYDTSLASTDWFVCRGSPERPIFNRTPYDLLILSSYGTQEPFTSGVFPFRNVPTVQVTAKWGYAAYSNFPAVVKEATLVQASRWWKRSQSAWADTLASADMGTLMYQKVLDPAIQLMLVKSRLIRPSVLL